jgi:hypothetical protein
MALSESRGESSKQSRYVLHPPTQPTTSPCYYLFSNKASRVPHDLLRLALRYPYIAPNIVPL